MVLTAKYLSENTMLGDIRILFSPLVFCILVLLSWLRHLLLKVRSHLNSYQHLVQNHLNPLQNHVNLLHNHPNLVMSHLQHHQHHTTIRGNASYEIGRNDTSKDDV